MKKKKLRKENKRLKAEVLDAHAFAFNMLPGRTLLDQKGSLDEQLELIYNFIRNLQRFDLALKD